jgi:tocopherol O-methyltransferase
MESGEHMPDKQAFVNELVRVTAPGGRIIVVTWCHRELKPEESSLSLKEQRLLKRINDGTFNFDASKIHDSCEGTNNCH